MTWQDYTLTMAEIMAWPITVIMGILIVVTGAVTTSTHRDQDDES